MYRALRPSWSELCSTSLRRSLERGVLRRSQRSYGGVGAGIAHSVLRSHSLPFEHTGAPNAAADDKTLREIFDNGKAWDQFRHKLRDPNVPRTGLFHNKDLTSPSGIRHYAERTLVKAKQLVTKICSAQTHDELAMVVQDLDRLSDLLCRVIDMADFVRASHPDQRIIYAAHNAYGAMFEYMQVLNTTTGLYESLKKVLETPEVLSRLNQEEKVVANILYADFEKSGINLPANVRNRWVKLMSEIADLGSQFANGVKPAEEYVEFSSYELKGMDPVVARSLADRGRIRIPTTGMTTSHALRTVEDPMARKKLYIASHTSHPSQIHTLEQLLKKRAELATLVGRESFSHLTLQDKMAKTPFAVREFLSSLAASNLPAAQAEFDLLTALKQSSWPTTPNVSLDPWDREYYISKLSHSFRSRAKQEHTLSSYFSLGTVMQGLSRIFHRLYGIRFVPREPVPGEVWTPDVRRLDMISDTDGHIAVVYCDLFSRPGKLPNPAHFTLRCSRRISPEELAEYAASGESASDGMAASRVGEDGSIYQLPTIALVCDFPPPSSSFSGSLLSSGSSKPTLLSFREVTTLFHEMGHAVHSMLGRTALHNVAGTRCATDWSELPSILMEHFAKDPEVLGEFARHYSSDQPLPYEQLKEVMRVEGLMEAGETRHQIVLAVLDQAYNSTLPLEGRGSVAGGAAVGNSGRFDSTAVYRDVEREFSLLPHAEGTSWQGFFGHLYGYGATYYAYLFDTAIAGKIWRDVFQGQPLARERGERFKEEVLRWGGARDGWSCLAGVLGREELKQGGEQAMREVGRWGRELK
ncbi:hypothetical protein FPQ18DRAFT_275250 [Pyronema domesticum]|uniref:Mitochondrial intermediate peptidase n=1 Tax=Pyronema omphalodes (strain CBS 100304) TaxID=1076935 RepID=U4LS18_PYROM|nr:hypothetical protein FPQ18DRAFT_275250 [Pyronema domesticum]CCX34344.1 Similar to Mitochondrial intermediate peptidase; acc. no. A6SHZ5 [Pyronema omphalodes CBS 100304]